jgi:hypothetical protein
MKPFWKSKTFWACVIGAGVIAAQWVSGQVWVPVGIQASIGVAVAFILRVMTNEGIGLPPYEDEEY